MIDSPLSFAKTCNNECCQVLNLENITLKFICLPGARSSFLKIDGLVFEMQVQVCIHLCCILGPTLLSSLLRLFNVAVLIWRPLHMIPYCLNRRHHGLTRSVRNLDRPCTLHQIIQWWSQSLIYSLRFSWKLFFGVSGRHLASSLLILYHELVIVQFILFWSNCDILLDTLQLYSILFNLCADNVSSFCVVS